MGFEFTLNGRTVAVEGKPTTMTLLEFLRSSGLTGTKQGCAEGDCGACSVAIVERDGGGRATYRSVNSCIALLPLFAGREVVTVEGLSCGKQALHPVQDAMVEHFGSQCGYCTPGFVMSLFEGYYRRDCAGAAEISDQLCGNLCRCTGYRPIRDAALDALGRRARAGEDAFGRRLTLPVAPPPALEYEAAGQRFIRPASLDGLFAALARHPGARLVAGATELGVDVTKKASSFPVLIATDAVPELSVLEATEKEWRIGGAVTLTAVGERVGPEFPSLAKMLAVFAARQIRNRATLGGNLATASPIGDGAPLLLTLDAELVLASASGRRRVPLAGFFTAYRKTLLAPGEVILEVVIPRAGPQAGLTRRSDFLKVSKRRELDISIVAGAFSVDTDAGGVVRRARLAYGGVAATPARAAKAEAALLGRTLADSAADVARALEGEFTPIDDARGSARYRRGLIVSLWEKFASADRSEAQDGPRRFERGAPNRADDASRQLRHESATLHVTGGAMYADDTAQRRPMLDAWPVCAPHARARILRRDASLARAMPGVAAVLMAEDIPGHNNVGTMHDEELFAEKEVKYHGQVVALVVGSSPGECRAAAAKVLVEYEPLEPLVGIREAIARGSFHSPPHTIARGDAEKALRASPHVLEGEFEFGGQEHFYLETQASWAEPGELGSVFVCASTQHPTEIQHIVSDVLGEPKAKVVVQSPRMGGGFGGKETQGNAFAAMVALAALRTGRPVRIQLDRDLDMMITGKRHPFHARFRVGYDRRGMLLAAAVDLTSDGGWSLDLSQPVTDRALFHIDNGYYIPALRVTGLIARTNVASNTAFRGFGGPQGMLVIEEIVDRVARRLGLAPEVVRGRNLYRGKGATNTTHFLQEIGDNRLQAVWKQVQKQAGFERRRRAVDAWNRRHPRVKRGLAVTPVKFGISFTLTHFNQAGSLVLLYTDGTAQVNHGGTEMGQGLHTKIQGVAMRELGLPAERVRLMPTTTEKVPNTSATAASSGADLNGAAVRNACVALRERLVPVAAELLSARAGRPVAPSRVFFRDGLARAKGSRVSADLAEVCTRAHQKRISLSAAGYYATPGIHWDWSTSSGRPFQYFVCGAAVAEVELDGYNGMHRVLRVDVVHDVGNSLNPGIDRGQIEGGLVQGIGWLTREELLWDGKGRLLTHSASTYQIPALSDAPLEMAITLLPRAEQPGVIHGSKASGEPPFMLAFSVREALRDAVAAFGAKGEVSLASPATCEALYTAVQAARAAR